MKFRIFYSVIFMILYLAIVVLSLLGYAYIMPKLYQGAVFSDIHISTPVVFFVQFVVQQIFVFFALFLSLKIVYRKEFKSTLKYCFSNKLSNIFKIALYTLWYFLLYIIVMAAIYYFVQYFQISLPWLFGEQQVAGIINWLSPSNLLEYIVIVFCVALFWPLCEEIVYRWFITRLLVDDLWKGVWIALGALCFTVIHMEFGVFFNLFILSLFLGFMFIKHRSWHLSLFFHIVINSIALTSLFY